MAYNDPLGFLPAVHRHRDYELRYFNRLVVMFSYSSAESLFICEYTLEVVVVFHFLLQAL